MSIPKAKKYWQCAISYLLITIVMSSFYISTAVAQGFYTEFGQNRVQYHEFDWSYYESPNFVTYFYQGGFDLGKYAVYIAEESLENIKAKLEYGISNKIEIMVYHNLSDLKQTNIGLGQQEANTGGRTKIIGNKMFVYFNGDYQHFEQQIREGIAKVQLDNMVHGGNIQEVIQNAVLLNLPPWFTNGLVAYLSEEWSTAKDQQLKERVLSGAFNNFNKLYGEESTFAGHALWHYIAQLHGEDAIPNLLYLTRVNRSIESGFIFVLGNSVKTTIDEFNAYYSNIYGSESKAGEAPAKADLLEETGRKVRRRGIIYNEVKVSPNGRYIAYTTNESNRVKVYLHDTETDKKKIIVRAGSRAPNQLKETNYPLLAWDRGSQKLAVVYEKRDKIRLMTYKVEDGEKEQHDPMNKLQQVVDIAFTLSPDRLVISAVKEGQSDLFLYAIPNTKLSRLTNDHYSDLQPRYVKLKNKSGIAFISNRPNDTLKKVRLDEQLPDSQYDVYFYQLGTVDDTLLRITDTPLADERLPMQYDSTYLSFLSDESGVKNVYVAYFDSVFVRKDQRVFFRDSLVINPDYSLETAKQQNLIDTIIYQNIYETVVKTSPISNFKGNILGYDVAVRAGKMVQLQYNDGNYQLFKSNTFENPLKESKKINKTTYRQQLENLSGKSRKKIILNKPSENSVSKLIITEKETPKDTVLLTPNDSIPADSTVVDSLEKETVVPPSDTSAIDTDNYFFQSEFDFDEEAKAEEKAKKSSKPKPSTTVVAPKPTVNDGAPTIASSRVQQQETEGEDKKVPLFRRTKIRKHKTRFSIDQIVSQLDNSILFNQYESFDIGGSGFTNPDLNAFIKVGIKDLFEDYRIIGGFRFPVGLGGSEYFVEFQNLKKQLDKKILLYRKAATTSNLFQDIPVEEKRVTYYGQYAMSWPFDVNTSLRAYFGSRNDRITYLATDMVSLSLNDRAENWLFTKLEYVFDNTIPVDVNILNGTRYKVYAEFHKPFNAIVNRNEFTVDFKDTGFLGIIGGDFRHYQRVHKQIIWANRLATATSFGSKKMIYYMGGVENWLLFDQTKKFNNETPVNDQVSYGFKSLATNMRGFAQNIRNGSSYAVINSELRIPIFAYLTNKPIRSDFLRNFQIIAFGDVGTAWEGWSPFSKENRYYNIQVPAPDPFLNSPVIARVNYFKNPIVLGYGLGARSKLLGYFLRVDAAWGVDSGARSDVRWYVSMGMDF